ncbi:MAG: alpha-L-rhamnosidase C-terminal domain-containing protein [Acidobacteriota bacterium]
MNCIAKVLLGAALATSVCAQAIPPGARLDPARDPAVLHRPMLKALPEQYIWTATDAAALRPDHARFSYRQRQRKVDPHVFRGAFQLKELPAAATLYIAGPRSVKAYLNGTLVLDTASDPKSPLAVHVFCADVRSALRTGRNILAIEAVRGWGIVAASDSPLIQQLSFGEALAAKIVPAAPGVYAPALAISGPAWRSVAASPQRWQSPQFDDRSWPRVQALGAIESLPEFFQWNLDAGFYDWPGYRGMSPNLRTYSLSAAAVTHQAGGLDHVDALINQTSRSLFAVRMPAKSSDASHAPALLLDFGREVAGRLFVQSACNCEAQILLSYGESESEALSGKNYLGTNLLRIPPHGVARGPKSGFRYAWLRFVGGAPQTAFRAIRLEGIAYPVHYKGSFESSDPLLNRIWTTAAYTAHLCMQDGVWDAAKRDRGWWAGDLDVSGPVISDVFGDEYLLNATLAHLIPPAGQHVNGIPGYTALWITTLADLYRHSGDRSVIEQRHAILLQLLKRMDQEFDGSGRFLNTGHHWLFVDWSPGLYAFTDEAAEGTELEFVRAYREAAWLLVQMGDGEAARHYGLRAATLAAEARKLFLSANGVFGDRWQLNAMAVLAGVATPQDDAAIWTQVFQGIGRNGTQTQTITPYFNDYLLDAMARMGRRRAALDWMREYWGGMLAEGATSFWEGYDLRWPRQNPHLGLQADGTSGYFVSMAHGWSAGPAAWLMEELLGVKATEPGFRKAQVRPALAGLQWVRGAVPTPRGLIRVRADARHVQVDIPPGTEAAVLLPAGRWTQNGVAAKTEAAEGGSRVRIVLRQAGSYSFVRE